MGSLTAAGTAVSSLTVRASCDVPHGKAPAMTRVSTCQPKAVKFSSWSSSFPVEILGYQSLALAVVRLRRISRIQVPGTPLLAPEDDHRYVNRRPSCRMSQFNRIEPELAGDGSCACNYLQIYESPCAVFGQSVFENVGQKPWALIAWQGNWCCRNTKRAVRWQKR